MGSDNTSKEKDRRSAWSWLVKADGNERNSKRRYATLSTRTKPHQRKSRRLKKDEAD